MWSRWFVRNPSGNQKITHSLCFGCTTETTQLVPSKTIRGDALKVEGVGEFALGVAVFSLVHSLF